MVIDSASLLLDTGSIAILATVVGLIVRLIKTDALNATLAALGVSPIPKHALPWLALIFGVVGALLTHTTSPGLSGLSLQELLATVMDGVLAGGFAIAGDQTIVKTSKLLLAASPIKNNAPIADIAQKEPIDKSVEPLSTPTSADSIHVAYGSADDETTK